MTGTVLGFNTTTKKSDVAKYFKTVHDTVSSTKTALEKIVDDMKAENNPNAEATDVAVKTLVSEKLSKIIEGAKTVSEAIDTDNNPIGDVVNQNGGAVGDGIESLVNGIKSIVEVVLNDKGKPIGNPIAGDDKGPVKDAGNAVSAARTGSGGSDGDARKLFDKTNAGSQTDAAKAAKDAAKAVGAVTGADILQSIVKNDGKAITLAKNDKAINGVAENAKDAEIAGGITLRAMAKGAKFANSSSVDNDGIILAAVKGAAVSAVTKILDTLTIAMRKTIDEGLKAVKDAMKINISDTPVSTEAKN
ncbi:Variable outer membrane protein (plasmid) [Borrelia coriaceae ATCC 43381]|uniref:Variable large protein n=1 Tax=Borrelia coriaceae ATCC 43381 TaxID=1408429 RepID=W5SYD4_9SPIR|nr:Variable outer membrane protein [Borrelia coriaceae ATCC 43381]